MSQLTLLARVAGRRIEADGIVGLDFVAVQPGQALPPFTPGSHIDVEVMPGLIRQYSLCGASGHDRYSIAVLREPRSKGGSIAVHEKLTIGDPIRIGLPRNRFELIETAGHSILIAGGIGVTPLIAMAHRLDSLGRSFEFHYISRSPERMAFRESILSSSFAGKSTLYFTHGDPSRRMDLTKLLAPPRTDSHVYVCGPEGLIAAVLDFARRQGWPDATLHREYFANATAAEPGTSDVFVVRIASTGEEFEVPADRTVVSVLTDAGYVVPTFCEQGTCGTCLTRVVAGVPDHKDVVLSDDERARSDQFTPCCSRSKTALLVLDL